MITKLRQAIFGMLNSSSFAKNVLVLMTGTTLAQVLAVVVAPILTRVYNPNDYGISVLYGSIAGIIAVIASWYYEMTIVLPDKDEDAANLLALSIIICFGMAGLFLVLTGLFGTSVASLLGAPKLAHWLWFLPLSIISAGVFKAFTYWSTRRKNFERIAARTITQSTLTSVTQVGAGIGLHAGPGGLISGSIIGEVTATSVLAYQIGRDEGKTLRSYINIKDIKRMLIRYKDFPLYSSWAILFNTISGVLPPLVLSYFFSPVIVGFFALGQRVLILPMGIIGSSIAQVFFPKANEAFKAGELKPITLQVFRQLVGLGVVPFLLLALVAPELFTIVFGAKWMAAGMYLQWLVGWIFFQFISSPMSNLYTVLEKQREFLFFNISLFVTRLLVLIIGGITGKATLSIMLFGLTGMVFYMIYCYRILSFADINFVNACSVLINELFRSVPYVLAPVIVFVVADSKILFVSSAILAGIVFLVIKGRFYLKQILIS